MCTVPVACFLLLFVRPTSTAASLTQTSTAPTTVMDNQLPSHIQLEFTAKGHVVKFSLTKSTRVDYVRTNGYLTVLFGERGRVRQWNNTAANTSNLQYAVYEDPIKMASVVRVFSTISSRVTYMGTFHWSGTVYVLKPYATRGLSQLPYTGQFIDIVIAGATYRLLPVETILNFDDSFMHTSHSTKTKTKTTTSTTTPRPRGTLRSTTKTSSTSRRRGTTRSTTKPPSAKRQRACLKGLHNRPLTKRCKHILNKRHRLASILNHSLKKKSKQLRRQLLRRSKRQADQVNYTVNMLIVADYAIYYRWYIESMATTAQAKQADAMQNLVFYYSNIINGVNMRYSSIVQPDFSISIRIAGIYVATTPTDSQFTEGPDVKIGTNYAKAYTALVKFGSFVAETLRPVISFDQATLFTGNRLLVFYTDGSNSTISGLAYIQGICSNYSVSINYEAGEYSSIQTAAHELGHNLGAQHDGTGNNCSSADQYVMAAGSQYLTDSIFNHPFNFSSCSADYFRNYLSATTASCLFHSPSNITRFPPSGQRYNADKQCQLLYGPQSFYCAGGSRDQSICREMQCWVPEYDECFAVVEQRAFDGTTCGNHTWCMWGTCVYDNSAPAAPDSCVYGDYRDVFILSATLQMNCSMIGVNQPWRCYSPAYSLDCCHTCSVIRNNATPGCEYGNNDWTGTCATISRQDCYDATVRSRCCSTCGKMANQAAPAGCEFGDRAQWCASQPSENCYSVGQTCCDSCQQYYTAVTGCEYGDRAGWCPGYLYLDCSDPYYADLCCGTCMSKSSSTARTITTSTALNTTSSVTSAVSTDGVTSITTTREAVSTNEETTTITPPTTTTESRITTLGITPTETSTGSLVGIFSTEAPATSTTAPQTTSLTTATVAITSSNVDITSTKAPVITTTAQRATTLTSTASVAITSSKVGITSTKALVITTTAPRATTLKTTATGISTSKVGITSTKAPAKTTTKPRTTTLKKLVNVAISSSKVGVTTKKAASKITTKKAASKITTKKAASKTTTRPRATTLKKAANIAIPLPIMDITPTNTTSGIASSVTIPSSQNGSTSTLATDIVSNVTMSPTSTYSNWTCPLGDGASFCSTILAFECYNYGQLCCDTCPNYYTGVLGCEYGDQVEWCGTYVQGPHDCNEPDVATYCCRTCASHSATDILRIMTPTCTDNASWCSGIFPGYCYDSEVASTCCAECSRVNTDITNCQYGDRYAWCQPDLCNQNALECCASCK